MTKALLGLLQALLLLGIIELSNELRALRERLDSHMVAQAPHGTPTRQELENVTNALAFQRAQNETILRRLDRFETKLDRVVDKLP